MLGNRLGTSGPSHDEGVRDTNDDAQLSKLCCVRHGYFQDSFVHHFVRRPVRRSPLINRGYYSRYAALRSLLMQFLAIGLGTSIDASIPHQPQQQQTAATAQEEGKHLEQLSIQQPDPLAADKQGQQLLQQQQQGQQPQQQQQQQEKAAPKPPLKRQVLVLGAGYDTTYFQLASEGIQADKYIEVDFRQVTQKKAAAIQQLPELLACIGGQEAAAAIDIEAGRVVSDRYCLLPADLRDLSQLQAALQEAGLDPAAPTYVLSECVLVYLQPQQSREVVRWLAEHLECAAMAIYEQIQPNDAFGQQMLINLESRGCALLGIEATPTLEAHRKRYTDCGWHRAEAYTMDHVYSRCIDPQDKRRIERLEIFDEFEEWHLIQQHYCIAVGIKDSSGLLQRFGLPHFQPRAALPPGLPQLAPGGGSRLHRPPPPPPPRFVS